MRTSGGLKSVRVEGCSRFSLVSRGLYIQRPIAQSPRPDQTFCFHWRNVRELTGVAATTKARSGVTGSPTQRQRHTSGPRPQIESKPSHSGRFGMNGDTLTTCVYPMGVLRIVITTSSGESRAKEGHGCVG